MLNHSIKNIKDIGPYCRVRAIYPNNFSKNRIKSQRKSAGSPIHDRLCFALDEAGIQYIREFRNAIPGRKFRLDIALEGKIGIEVDGWQNHGKTKSGFQKDREKQNLYVEHGWRILRYTAHDIYKNIDMVIEQIKKTMRR